LAGPEGQLEVISICKNLSNPDAAHVNVQLGRARCIHSSSMKDKERNQPATALTAQRSKSDNKMQIEGILLVGYAMMLMRFESWKNMS
jgi:hypothetical protein